MNRQTHTTTLNFGKYSFALRCRSDTKTNLESHGPSGIREHKSDSGTHLHKILQKQPKLLPLATSDE